MARPVTFPGQYQKEKVVLILRRHWFVLAVKIAGFALLAALILGGYFAARRLIPDFSDLIFYPVINLVLAGVLLLLWGKFYLMWLDYYLDIWIVTDERIINIEQEGLWNRVASELKIYRIQDVTVEIRGFDETTFDYGNVLVQSAAEKARFTFEQVPHPGEVKRVVVDLHDEYLRTHGGSFSEEGDPELNFANNAPRPVTNVANPPK